jgi:sporulation protein YlmC with PRC-barrel domain
MTPLATQPVEATARPEATQAPSGEAERTMVRSSELLDSDVVDEQGNLLGVVMEVLVDTTGAIQYVIFDANEFLQIDAGDTGGTGTSATPVATAAGDTGTSATPMATAVGTAQGTGTTEDSGLVAVPYDQFEVASMVTGTGTDTDTDSDTAATPAATAEGGTGADATPAATSEAGANATPRATAVGDEEGEMENVVGLADENTVLVYTGDTAELAEMQIDMALLDAEGWMIDTTLAAEDDTDTNTGTSATPAATAEGGTGTSATPAATAEGQGTGDVTLDRLDGLIRVSRFSDFDLRNAEDEDLGEVEELLIELRDGMVQYGVVDFGGFLGIGETSVAVPWERFTLQAADTATDANFRLEIDQATLENAPQIDLDALPSWPAPLTTDWDVETRTFWETAS